MERKLLVTGFEPFGGEAINPAWEAVQRLPERIGDCRIMKLQVPTVYEKAGQTVLRAAQELQPDAIVCIGQAGGRSKLTPEVIGINLRDASIPDNAGAQPWNVPVIAGAPDAIFSTLPVHEITAAVQKQELPCALSYSAGTFVCNDLLYTLLYHFRASQTRVGFIHVPFLPEQAKEGVPSLSLDVIVRTLTAFLTELSGLL